ncbi:MAG: sugar nucleotide-binding protein, partial [Methylococcales bacterium]
GFTEEIAEIANDHLGIPLAIKTINAIPTANYPTPAKRPMNSRLVLTKLESIFGLSMPAWQNSLQRCMQEIIHY